MYVYIFIVRNDFSKAKRCNNFNCPRTINKKNGKKGPGMLHALDPTYLHMASCVCVCVCVCLCLWCMLLCVSMCFGVCLRFRVYVCAIDWRFC